MQAGQNDLLQNQVTIHTVSHLPLGERIISSASDFHLKGERGEDKLERERFSRTI